MAYLNKLKDLRVLKPSSTEILYKTVLGDSDVNAYDPNKNYHAGDKIYIIQDGKLVIYECKNDTSGSFNPDDWIVSEDLSSTGSGNSNPNKPQQISPIDDKILQDILNLQLEISKLTDVSGSNVQKIDFTDDSQVSVIGDVGKLEFGRIYF